ncbi:NADH:flavin oxidoreductase [Ponticaulis sp.]|uniref:oxidoreductase n=1 Tax=Ponticaulis sp. TaxID=2020902 RepID=UPI000C521D6C|nr:NADH:flavin oxidoreductase [Ponticaulis sp.]MAF56896.1 NADH:flavin oxidoreductase [Ponticaulis sp.]MBN04603.1 NADH:flavin oxidoreductase [Ponticaulis sp.]
MTTPLGHALTLPCGLVLPNRIAKAALSEFMADSDGVPSEHMISLYRRWGEGGAGLVITGNVMVDPRYIEAPGNVALNGKLSKLARSRLLAIAEAGKSSGSAVFMQLSHAGALALKQTCERPVAPSLLRRGTRGIGAFSSAPCRAVTTDEIKSIVAQFAAAAEMAADAGFDGVQIQCGHGHLISQFLSPRLNRRTDDWGGSLHNRARLMLEIIAEVRARLPGTFAISIKLNASDFIEDGFSFDDCLSAVEWLNGVDIDLIEISGGSRVQPQMFGLMQPDCYEADGRLLSGYHETGAYFGGFSKAVKAVARMPVLVTGGVRRRKDAERIILRDVADLVGFGRSMCLDNKLPEKLLSGDVDVIDEFMPEGLESGGHLGPDSSFGFIRDIHFEALMAWHSVQMARLSNGSKMDASVGLLSALRAFRRSLKATRQR